MYTAGRVPQTQGNAAFGKQTLLTNTTSRRKPQVLFLFYQLDTDKVKDFPIEYMHCLCLCVVRLSFLWSDSLVSNGAHFHLQQDANISSLIEELRSHLPS